MAKPMSADDKKWQAESDARTLAEAQVILADKKRHMAATEAAKGMAKDKHKEANSMQNVADKMYPTMAAKK